MVRLVNTSSKTIVCILVKSRGKILIVKGLKKLKTNFIQTMEIRKVQQK